jgi:hypothetical protein
MMTTHRKAVDAGAEADDAARRSGPRAGLIVELDQEGHVQMHRWIAVSVLIAASLLVAAPTSAMARTYVTGVGRDFRVGYKPANFSAGTGVGGGALQVRGVRWSSWSASRAVGRGKLRFNICDPTCADGNYRTESVRIRLSRPRRGCEIWTRGKTVVERRALFTTITFSRPGEDDFVTQTADTEDCRG